MWRKIWAELKYESVSKSFRTESITKYTLTTINTRWEATQRVMAVKLTRLTHKIVIQLQLMAESCTICSCRSRRPVRKCLGTSLYSKRIFSGGGGSSGEGAALSASVETKNSLVSDARFEVFMAVKIQVQVFWLRTLSQNYTGSQPRGSWMFEYMGAWLQ
jgi:hypothetical protein